MFTRDLVSDWITRLPDRAEVIERAWATSFEKACAKSKSETCPDLNNGFLKLWPQGKPAWPALILNGTVVETSGRAVASNLDLHCEGGGSAVGTCGLVDVTDILAYQPNKLDLTATGAVNVSARFPVLGPSAVTVIDKEGHKRSVVDGGYFDNSGALTLEQVMNELMPLFKDKDRKIVPIVIQLTSDPDFVWWKDDLRGHLDAGNLEPGGHQLVMPLRTYLGLRSSYGRQAMLGLRSLAERDGIYIHFDQCQSVALGGRVPLGWVISNKAQQSLKSLLKIDTTQEDLGAATNSTSDYEKCRRDNVASLARVADCLADVNSTMCLGKEADVSRSALSP